MAEKRLIDANALSKSINEGSGTELQKFFADVCVATAPTVDAVEVVRCRDCTRYGDDEWCPLLCMSAYTEPNDFCSYGERKETRCEK